MRRAIISIGMALSLSLASAQSAHAFFGGIVFDPNNFTQNLYTASRSLIQIRQQVSQLRNEARMLIGQAKNLANLDYTAQYQLLQILESISALTDQAKNVSYQVGRSRDLMREHYPQEYANMSDDQMLINAETQWENSRTAFEESVVLQSTMIKAVKADTGTLNRLMSESQSASGSLSAAQAGNQLLALLIKQNMQMQQMNAVQYRAQSLEQARHLSAEKEARQKHIRFVGSASAYRSGGL